MKWNEIEKAEASGFTWLDIKNEHLLAVAAMPLHDDHRDPSTACWLRKAAASR